MRESCVKKFSPAISSRLSGTNPAEHASVAEEVEDLGWARSPCPW
jgi:hypothetical protein